MFKRVCKVMTALLLATPAPTAAEDSTRELLSGTQNQMVINCNPFRGAENNAPDEFVIPDRLNAGICWGAFLYIDAMLQVKNEKNQHLLAICKPQEVTIRHLIEEFLAYADEHAEFGNKSFAYSAQLALFKAYPCAGRAVTVGEGR
jgi:hypothetical protein